METTTDRLNTPSFAGDLLPLAVGTRLQEFVIEALIGVGGFGIVYKAHDTLLNRSVAIKEYMPSSMAVRFGGVTVGVRTQSHSADFHEGKTSFMNEARMLAQFRHPALVEVHRFWEQNSTAYMAMPYYQGQTFKEYLRNFPDNSLDESRLCNLLLPILDALQRLHADQVYHRDISPDNILVLEDGRSILLDLGAARRLESQSNQAVTMLVKPGYAPIEQYAADTAIGQGPWTDIYAWGATAYFALMGKPPPPSASRIMNDSMKSLASSELPGFSLRFLQAIDAALAVRPDDRPQSVQILKTLLGIEEISKTRSVISSVVAPDAAGSAESSTLALTKGQLPNQPKLSASAINSSAPKKSLIASVLITLLASLAVSAWWFNRTSKVTPVAPEPVAAQPVVNPSASIPAPTLTVEASPAVAFKPMDDKPVEDKPVNINAIQARPVESVPVESKPVDLKPVDLKPARARLAIQPWGEVFVDGVSQGVSPPLKFITLSPGTHRIEIRNSDYPAFVSTQEVKAGQTVSLSHTFQDAAPSSK